MKIAIVFDSLGYGGIESVGVNYIKLMLDMGHAVDVYNLHPTENAMISQIDSRAKYIPLSFDRKICPDLYTYGIQKWWWGKFAYPVISIALELYLALKKIRYNNQYDVAISFSGHINDLTFVAKEFVKAKRKICWCHGTLLSYLAICDAYPILYKKIDVIVTLSDMGEQNVYAGHNYLYDKMIVKIYNPVFIKNKFLNQSKIEELRNKYGQFILMVARATEPKDYKTAINAMRFLKDKGYEKFIIFVGDGPDLDEYKEYAEKLQVQDLCVFEGSRDDVQNYIYASYINILASKWEGLPTVIAEAMAMGKPCVMTKSDGGEISDGGKYCYLTSIGDYEAIGNALIELFSNIETYKAYAKLSKERFICFEPEFIKNQLATLLEG